MFYKWISMQCIHASLEAQRLKCLPGMLETWVRSLGRGDPLEKEKATHSSTLAWRIPWTEEPRSLQAMGSQNQDTTERLHFHFHAMYSVWGQKTSCQITDYYYIQFSSVAQSCLTLCDPMNRSMPGPPVHHQLPEFTQTHVH